MKNKEDVKIILLSNNEKDYISGIDIDGVYYEREENQSLNDFLTETINDFFNQYGINIFPYLKEGKTYSMNHEVYNEEIIRLEKEEYNNKIKKQKIFKRAAAIAVGVSLITGLGFAKMDNTKSKTAFAKTKVETNKKIKDIENNKLSELIEKLDVESGQKATINKILKVEDYFNNEAAPTVSRPEDKGNQLFLTTDEMIATYIYSNIETIGTKKIGKIFGTSDIIWLNKEKSNQEPVYEELDADSLAETYTDAMIVTNYYYIRATEKSGLGDLFEDKDEKKFFESFENLVLEYNKNPNQETKSKINKKLKEIFISGDVDNLYEKYPGASAIIAKGIVPILQAKHVISEQMLIDVVEVNETLSCNEIYKLIEKMVKKYNCKEEGLNEEIISKIVELKNKELLALGRNVDMRNSIGGHSLNELLGDEQGEYYDGGYSYGSGGSREVVKRWRKIYHSKDRKELIKKFGKKKVEEAERKAYKKAKIKEKNKKEAKRAKDIKKGNNDAVDDIVKNDGKAGKPDKNKSKDYKDQYNKTSDELEKKIEKEKEDWEKNHQDKEVEEKQTEHYNDDGTKKESEQKPKQESKPEPKEEPKEESKAESKAEKYEGAKKVKSVVVDGKEYEVSKVEETEDKARTR